MKLAAKVASPINNIDNPIKIFARLRYLSTKAPVMIVDEEWLKDPIVFNAPN